MSKARYDLSIQKSEQATTKGVAKTYGFDLIDYGSPDDHADHKIVESATFVTKEDAQKYFNKIKNNPEYSDLTVNGQPGADPFNDPPPGSFKSQTDVEFGGFGVGIYDDPNRAHNTTPSGERHIANKDGDIVLVKIDEKDLGNLDPVVTQKRIQPVQSAARTELIAQDLCGLPEDEREIIFALSIKELAERKTGGVFGSVRHQALVDRQMVPCEKLVGRGIDNNAFIVIGNDRLGKPHHGCGVQGHTKCDMIDIVVGLGGYCAPEMMQSEIDDEETGEKKKVFTKAKINPSPYLDAARVYLSQKTHVDKNFGIGEFGQADNNTEDKQDDKNNGKYEGKSAFVAKADGIRLIGRESIRIVTGTDVFNSKGGKVLGKSGVELIAMNKIEDLQPLVLGDNLLIALNVILDNLEALAKLFHGFTKYQSQYNRDMQQHVHATPFFGLPSLVSSEAIGAGIMSDVKTVSRTELSILKHLTNIQGVRKNYLTESGKKFINSELNKCN